MDPAWAERHPVYRSETVGRGIKGHRTAQRRNPTVTSAMLTAWGDESGSNAVRDPGTYILAAVLGFDEHLVDLRDAVERLRPRGALKLHWRDDSDTRHHMVLRALSKMSFESLVVVRSRRVTGLNTAAGSVWTCCSASSNNLAVTR
jgi:trans-aconitate methyltransferase